ncbi:DMT family transporter [Castellaniella daejeonensis]|jgi:drug/metabolite transporter (DMT)-like permease|uniref:DMT family transporter n=1 Tax=Castellaniella daejeonensis TaxID=659013 RepID=A0ABP3CW56_9BURK|nr:EamA family transporter [Castellaniella sp.]HET8704501.1 EamA family transporter [Castellaniella sp.]
MTARPDLVYGAVLAAALLHAGWNALIKRSADTLLSTTGIAAASAAIALAALPWLPAPAAASWPFILSSLILQIVYMRLLARIYRVADMSASYPVMRGTAPLLVAAASAALFHEALNPTALAGIAAICGGILCIGRRSTGIPAAPSGLRLALLNAAVIASYTLVDGAGVRQSGAPASYTLWIFLLQGCAMTLMGLRARPGALPSYLRAHWRSCLAGGFGSVMSYGVALWAMTLAPIAIIAALRETSILFGTLIAGLCLRERLGPARILGACILVLGAALLRLA